MSATVARISVPAGPEVMEISGRLDDGTAIALEEDALLCIQSGARRMVLDCRRLNSITGAGMRSILALAREMQGAGGRLAACNLQPQVEDMFDICGFDAIIPVYRDQNEACAALVG